MTAIYLAVDIGMTNIDLILESEQKRIVRMLANQEKDPRDQLRQAIRVVADFIQLPIIVGVTGGRYRALPLEVDGFRIRKIDEILALGLGGLDLSGLDSGLVVSAGTGVAMVAASEGEVHHVTGSAVGGGTLLGLSKIIVGTDEVDQIDRLALAGDASAVDIMLKEAVGGEVGRLPANANAVNLGKLNREDGFSRENLAAGLVRLVAQVIAVIAINAADASGMKNIILVGHLMDLKSIRKEINLVGDFYHRKFVVPDNPGLGTVTGVLSIMKNAKS